MQNRVEDSQRWGLGVACVGTLFRYWTNSEIHGIASSSLLRRKAAQLLTCSLTKPLLLQMQNTLILLSAQLVPCRRHSVCPRPVPAHGPSRRPRGRLRGAEVEYEGFISGPWAPWAGAFCQQQPLPGQDAWVLQKPRPNLPIVLGLACSIRAGSL